MALFRAEDYFKHNLKIHPILKPAVGGFMVGIIGLALPQVFGGGYDVMTSAMSGNIPFYIAFALIFAKIVSTSVSLGSGGSGGVFAPSIFIGCMTGSAFGYLVNYLFPAWTASHGAYAMVGLGAVMGAFGNAPLTMILMGYELTGNYQIILPIMTATMASVFVFRRYSRESYYTQKLRRQGVILWRGRDLAVMDRKRVGEVMHREFTSIPEDMPLKNVMDIVTESRENYFPVTGHGGALIGVISLQNIRDILPDFSALADIAVAKDIAELNVITLAETNNLNEAMEHFAIKDIEQLPVVRAEEGNRLIGMLSRTDVLATYKKEVLTRSREEAG